MASPTDPTASNWDSVAAALGAAPEVATSPSLASSLVQATSVPADPTQTPTDTAHALAGVATSNAADQVTTSHKNKGWFSQLLDTVNHDVSNVWDKVPGHTYVDNAGATAVSAAGTGLADVAHWANYPLAQVQHTYRYYRLLMDQKGPTAAYGELLRNSWFGLNPAMGIATPYINHVTSDITGKPVEGGLVQNVQAMANGQSGQAAPAYPDLWNQAAHVQISPGRDLAHTVGLHGGTGFDVVSGAGDLTFDVMTDPLLVLGKISTTLTGAQRAVNGAEDIMRMRNASKLHPAFAPVHRAVENIAKTKSAARIVENFPALGNIGERVLDAAGKPTGEFTGNTLALHLAKADTSDKVWNVLQDWAASGEFMNGGGTMPVLSLTKQPFRVLNNLAKKAQVNSGDLTGLDQIVNDPKIIAGGPTALRKALSQGGRFVNLFTNHAPTILNPEEGKGIVTHEMHPYDPKAPAVINALLRFSQSPAVANAVSDAYRNATTISERADIFSKAVIAMAHGAGIDDVEVLARGRQDMDGHLFKMGSGKHVNYGMDKDGKPLSYFPNSEGDVVSGPLFTTQGGMFAIPQYGDVMNAARQLSMWKKAYGSVDDFAYKFTSNVFKPGNLLSLGFPIRTAINEMATQIIGQGGMATVHAAVSNSLAHLATGALQASGRAVGLKTTAEDAKGIIAAMFHSSDAGWIMKVARNDKYLSYLADFYARHPSTWDPAFALDAAGHNVRQVMGDGDITGNINDNVARNNFPGEVAHRFGPDWTDYTPGSGIEMLGNATAGHAQTLAREVGAQVQAKAYRETLADLSANRTIRQPTRPGVVAGQRARSRYYQLTDDEIHQKAEEAATQAGHKWLTETPEGLQAQQFLKRERGSGDAESSDPLMAWSQARAQAIRGVSTNLAGDHLPNILDGIADGNLAKLRPDVLKANGLDGLPGHVPGKVILPKSLGSSIGRAVQFGFDRVIMPTMQTLAREPIFLQKYVEEREALESLSWKNAAGKVPGNLDRAKGVKATMNNPTGKAVNQRPWMTDDEVAHLAATRAALKMIPEIHNLADKSQFAMLARNYIPFFFAREQAYRRLARAVNANPFGFRKIQLAAHGLKDIGFINQDPQTGQESFTYPLSGELGRYLPQTLSQFGVSTATGIPSGFTGNIASLASGGDVPGYENAAAGWSPFVSIPLRGIAQLMPELRGPIDASVGSVGMSQPAWESIVPNSAVRNVIHTFEGEKNSSFANAMADAIQFQIAHGNTPPGGDMNAPGAQKWLDQIRTNTRILFTMKTLLGIGAPASPILKMGDNTISPKVQTYIQKYGVADGLQRFVTENPNDTAYTVFKSASKSGVAIPETQAAVDWADTHKDFINSAGKVGLLFLPQSTSPDPNALAAYKQEIASGLRMVKSPEKFAQDIMVQQGWNEYEDQKKVLDAYVAANTGNTAGITQAKSNFYAWANDTLAKSAPAWYADYNASNVRDGNRKLNADALVTMYQNNQVPQDSPMTPLIGQLVQQFQAYQAAYPNADQLGTTKAAMKVSWNAYLDSVVAAQPMLATVVSNAFRGL